MSNTQITDISTIFGEVLKRYRTEKEISQEELAYLAGMDRTFISRLERGVRQPTITTVIGLGLALDVSGADMIREAEKEYLRNTRLEAAAKAPGLVKEKNKPYSVSKRHKRK